ncbi:MAG: hypothetical protein GX567_16460 [Clostridia bacterium]|nr:hypothetical protein [Clostridia bacterium]
MSYLRGSFEKKEKNTVRDMKRDIIRHRLTILYRILIVLVVITLIGLGLYFNYQNMIYTNYEVLKRIEFEETTTASYMNYKGNILKYSQDGAMAFTVDNEMLWNETYEMQNAMVDVSGEYVVLGDYKGTMIYLLNASGKCCEVDAMLPVQKLCVSKNGIVAAVLEDGKTTWVRVYDKTGSVVAEIKTTMELSGYPVSVSLSDDGIKLAISYLYVDNGVLTSKIGFYNFGQVGQNEIDNFVSGYNYADTVVSYIEFINDSTAIAVSNDRFLIFRGSQKPTNEFEQPLVEEVKSVFHGDEYTGLVFASTDTEHKYRLDVYDEEGEVVFTKGFDIDYSDIILNKDTIIIYNSAECSIYNMRGVEKFKGTFDKSVLVMIPTEHLSKYILISGNRAEEIQLK